MSKEFDIEVQEEKVESTNSVQLPMNFLTFGEIDPDDVKVYIKQDVYKALEKLSSSDTSKELGSIILGDYCQELGKTHVIISHYVEAKYTDASASTLTFTHETWDYVHAEHERKYPDKKIIGWQHTHPNYGIFLSNYDMFIQENFFNLPFQVAYVIDPIQNIRGFFQWKDGKVEKLKGYYIYDDVGKPIKIEQIKVDNKQVEKAKPSKIIYALLSVLCVACLLLGGALISLKNDYQERLDEQEKIVSDIGDLLESQNAALENQNAVIEQQEDAIAKLEGYFEDGVLDTTNKTTLGELILMLENQEIKFSNQEKIIDELKILLEASGQDDKEIKFVSYIVKQGDTLSSICAMHELDYLANMRIVMAMNGIENPNMIYVGQSLLLPVTGEVGE